MFRPAFHALTGVLLIVSIASADSISISRFDESSLSGWETKSFKGITDYGLVKDGGEPVLRAQARGTASGLIRRIEFDSRSYRYLRWSWKVDRPLLHGKEKDRQGDDYAARVYVIFPGFFFWQTRALCYVFAGQLPPGECFRSPYTDKVAMVVLRSGAGSTGRWLTEERDIAEDYRRCFGEPPRRAGAIAIMTDSDNTGAEVLAWYGQITLSTSTRREL